MRLPQINPVRIWYEELYKRDGRNGGDDVQIKRTIPVHSYLGDHEQFPNAQMWIQVSADETDKKLVPKLQVYVEVEIDGEPRTYSWYEWETMSKVGDRAKRLKDSTARYRKAI